MFRRFCLFVATFMLGGPALAAEPQLVQRVVDVKISILTSDPAHLIVEAKGLVPTLGYRDIKLVRATYVTPPDDGIQDYFLMATPPEAVVAPSISEVSGSNQYNRFSVEAPWMKGVRVHGVGDGVIVRKFGDGLRVRKNIMSFTASELLSLENGIKVMKSRPASDRRSWTFQANIHGENSAASDALWNQCEHGSLHFLTWHRAYLLNFEEMLREASGDPNLCLPYWDWSTQRSLPAPFRNSASTLFDGSRSINNGALLPTQTVIDDLWDALDDLSFSPFSFGLEGSPHGAVHVMIGGNMGGISTSARDPIFWLHHCNIDRLWEQWLSMGGGRSNPVDSPFSNRTFTLAGKDGNQRSQRAGDLLQASSLGYRYDNLTSSSAVVPTAPPSAAVMLASHASQPSHGQGPASDVVAVSKPQASAAGSTSSSLGFKVERLTLQASAENTAKLRSMAPASSSKVRTKIRFVGVKAKQAPKFTYNVYLNLPDGIVDPEIKKLHRVGTLNLFGVGGPGSESHAGHANEESGHQSHDKLSMDVTRTIQRLQAADRWKEDAIVVTLEPVTPVATGEEQTKLMSMLEESAQKAAMSYERVEIVQEAIQ